MGKKIDENIQFYGKPTDNVKLGTEILIELNFLDKDKKSLEKINKKSPVIKNPDKEKFGNFENIILINFIIKDMVKTENLKKIAYVNGWIDSDDNKIPTSFDKYAEIEICQCELAEEDFNRIFPKAPVERRKEVLEIFNKYCCAFEINTPLRASHFFAQVKEEVGENINYQNEVLVYSAKRLKTHKNKILKDDDGKEKSGAPFSYFWDNPDEADKYGSIQAIGQKANSEAIANIVYDDKNRDKAFRVGNTEIGDGWKFRGKGFLQLTGRGVYTETQKEIQKRLPNENLENILNNPESIISSIKMGMVSSMAYWTMKNLNVKADNASWNKNNVDNITNIVNSGTPSKEDRRRHFEFIKSVLNK